MSQGDKLPAIAIIWTAVAAILIFMYVPDYNKVWLTVVLALAATISTAIIWRSAGHEKADQPHTEKAKRTGRISQLIDLLDDDEVNDLEAWMEARRDRRVDDQDVIDTAR